MCDFLDFGLTFFSIRYVYSSSCRITSKAKINVFWNFFFTLLAPSWLLHSKKIQKTLILAFEANSALSCENETKIVTITHSAVCKKKYREREKDELNWWSNIIDRITFETWKFLTSWYNGIMLSMKTSHVDILTPNIVIWTWTSVIFFLFSERKIAFEIITWNVSCLFICVPYTIIFLNIVEWF